MSGTNFAPEGSKENKKMCCGEMKNYLVGAVIITILALAGAAISYVYSYSSYVKSMKPASFRSFSVSGEGKVVAVPDVAEFSFSVITEGGKEIAKLQKENTDKTNKIIGFIKGQGVDAKDIKTQNYSISPRYQYFTCSSEGGACPPPEIVGYTVSQSVQVKVRNFDKIGELLAAATQNGANSVSELSFTIDDPTELQNKAREEAITKAKSKAEAIAKAGGFKLGQLLSINEGSIYPMYELPMGAGGGKELSAPAPAPVIEPGSQEISITVNLSYEIE